MEVKLEENGQSTVEVALLIPLLAVFLMLIIQVGLVAKQYVVVESASRTGARQASVSNSTSEILSKVRYTVPDAKVKIDRPSVPGQYLTVKVSDTVESSLPIVGIIFPDITVTGQTTMRVEK